MFEGLLKKVTDAVNARVLQRNGRFVIPPLIAGAVTLVGASATIAWERLSQECLIVWATEQRNYTQIIDPGVSEEYANFSEFCRVDSAECETTGTLFDLHYSGANASAKEFNIAFSDHEGEALVFALDLSPASQKLCWPFIHHEFCTDGIGTIPNRSLISVQIALQPNAANRIFVAHGSQQTPRLAAFPSDPGAETCRLQSINPINWSRTLTNTQKFLVVGFIYIILLFIGYGFAIGQYFLGKNRAAQLGK